MPTNATPDHRWTLRELRATYETITGEDWRQRPTIRTPQQAIDLLAPLYRDQPVEMLGVLGLDTRHRPIAHATISRGTICSTHCSPREVFQAGLLMNASALMLCHNHPSGDPTPSPDDYQTALTLQSLGAALNMPVLDSIIIGATDAYSILEERAYPLPERKPRS